VNDSLALRVREVIAEHFGIALDRLTDETLLSNDLSADQFDRMLIAIEDRFFGVEIDDTTIDDIKTIADVLRAIDGQTAAGRNATFWALRRKRGVDSCPWC
jgi:acyl carrier protein